MSCIYEVNLRIDAALRDHYDAWLREHVTEMLALPGFLDAQILAVEPTQTDSGPFERVVHYRLRDRAAFERYLAEHATAMRQAGQARFGSKVQASRRILRPLAG